MSFEPLVLLVGPPGPFQSALVDLLLSIPRVDSMQVAGNGSQALELIERWPPTLVILQAGPLGANVRDTLRAIKARAPCARCIVWTENAGEPSAAGTAGADAVLIQGAPPYRWVTTVERFLGLPQTR